MAKKERNFHGEADFLRHQLRTLAKEMSIEIKDTNFMKKEECQKEIEALNRVKYKKELETERNEIIEKFENDLIDRNNQIAELQKEKDINTLEIAAKNKAIGLLEKAKETNKAAIETLSMQTKELKETIGEKNSEIAELKAERTASQLTMEKLEEKIKQSEERTQKSLDSKNDFIDKLQEEIEQLRNRKWYQFWK